MLGTDSAMFASYAAIYDAAGIGQFSAHLAGLVLARLRRQGARARTVLDLACGSGDAALIFAQAGLQVVGVDRSQAMLTIAQSRSRDARLPIRWLSADMRALPIGETLTPATFDLVTCFADSINYLLAEDDLADTLAGIAQLLRPGGALVFDINSVAEYATWDELDRVPYDDGNLLVYHKLSFNRQTRIATGKVAWFVRGEDTRWWRGEETHQQRAWRESELATALEQAGLRLAERNDINGAPATADARRVIYVATR